MLKGYRVLIFNLIMIVLFTVKLFFPDAVVPSADDVTKHMDMIETVIGFVAIIGNLVLRFFTDTPVFKASNPTRK